VFKQFYACNQLLFILKSYFPIFKIFQLPYQWFRNFENLISEHIAQIQDKISEGQVFWALSQKLFQLFRPFFATILKKKQQ
jgi:hypothetical protein